MTLLYTHPSGYSHATPPGHPEQVARLDAASAVTPAYPYYPYWREGGFKTVNPPPV